MINLSIKISSAVLIMGGLLSNNIPSYPHVSFFQKTDSVKTVAIYSSNKSFFPDYNLDSLLSDLNQLNTDKNISYQAFTEDHTKTGFYADYVVNLNFYLKKSDWTAPAMEKVPVVKEISVRVYNADGSYYNDIQKVTTYEDREVPSYGIPAEGEAKIKIIEKSKNEKVKWKTISLSKTNIDNVEISLIIKLIQYMLHEFSQ